MFSSAKLHLKFETTKNFLENLHKNFFAKIYSFLFGGNKIVRNFALRKQNASTSCGKRHIFNDPKSK